MKKIRLAETIPNWMSSGGIFTYLNALAVPWSENSTVLDFDYIGGHSGQKRVSPMVDALLTDDNELDTTGLNKIATTALAIFGNRWDRMYDQLSIEYNPIHNYSMTETETTSGTNSGGETHGGTDTKSQTHNTTNSGTDTTTNTGTQATVKTGTETTTHTGTQSTSGEGSAESEGTTTTEDGIAGFNSSSYSNDRNRDTDTSASSSSETSETRTDNLTDTLTNNTTDTRTDNLSQALLHGHIIAETANESLSHGETVTTTGSRSESRSLTRSGNIGVTTTAQMLESERELWKWNFFRNVVYPDLDSLLTIQTY